MPCLYIPITCRLLIGNSEMDSGDGGECIFPHSHILPHDVLQTW